MAISRVPAFLIPPPARQRARSVLMALPWLLGRTPAAAQTPLPLAPEEQKAPPSLPQAQLPPPAAPRMPAPEPEHPPTRRYEVGFQTTVIGQNLFAFRSPYQGKNSLRSRHEGEKSDTYTLYLGARAARHLEVYVDPEMARGAGIGQALGLAGYTNGDVIRNPTLGQSPYLARYFLRWTVPTGQGMEQTEPGENQIAGPRPAHRLVVTAGKLGTNDIFDVNRYANSTRTQFMNWALINNDAYDYAADTRGYTRGFAVEWVHPEWAVRLGSFQMPSVANGPKLAGDLVHNRGDQIEGELHPRLLGAHHAPLVARLLAYRNLAHMGKYRAALALARQTGTTPDITAVEKRCAVKYGFGLNFEQPLGDEGATGVFGRVGWNDGATETYAYTECDRTLCLGGQLSGARWHRPRDRVALALVGNGLSAAHRDYLAAGGVGFILGDGRLRYGPEQILETYYAYQLSRPLALSLDYQFVNHPGYNRDRGPVSVLSLRLHLEY
jgi:high affinity Mn2+ porin